MDLGHLAGKIVGGSLAGFLPHAADRQIVALLTKSLAAIRRSEIQEKAGCIEQTLPDRFDAAAARKLAEQWVERRAELYWGRMRGLYPSDWRIRLELEGGEHAREAVAGGRGVIVWFASFCDSSLMLRALAEDGLPLAHLSMATHGVPSGSRFGRSTIGRLHRRGENRYLRERVVIPNRKDPSYVKRLRSLLAGNHVVTIRGDLMGDSRHHGACLGKQLRIAAGAPSIAFQAEVPLLTAHVERLGTQHYRVVLGEPIAVQAKRRRDYIEKAVAEFGNRLNDHLRDNSPDWDGWWAIDRLVVKP